MKNRFQRYLDREFRYIERSAEANDYREEILGLLLDRAAECTARGMSDDEAYEYCIDSLGDFRSTLKEFDDKRQKAKRIAVKVSTQLLIALVFVSFATIAYLVVSFATEAWGKTWLILVGSIFAYIITLFAIYGVKAVPRKNWVLLRFAAQIVIVLLSTLVFLALLILAPALISRSWIVFLVMVIVMVGTDAIIATVTHRRGFVLQIMAFISVFTTLLYVMLGLLHVVPWHPYWLIVLLGFAVNMFIALLYAFYYVRRNEGRPLTQKREPFSSRTIDSDEYSHWRDEDTDTKRDQ